MTAEEYIKSKRQEDYPGGHLCYRVSEEVALKAVEMARNEKSNQGAFGKRGWICPKCGRVYSPYTSMCSYCHNVDLSHVQCAAESVRMSGNELGMPAGVENLIDRRFNK